MKNNIKKAPVKFWEALLYFQHFMPIFVFAPMIIITTLSKTVTCSHCILSTRIPSASLQMNLMSESDLIHDHFFTILNIYIQKMRIPTCICHNSLLHILLPFPWL